MRNFSMKKFGTPMRAAPGVAIETVGLSSVGEPSVLRVGFERSTCLRPPPTASSSVPVSDSDFGFAEPRRSPLRPSPPRPPLPPLRFGAAGADGRSSPSELPPCWREGCSFWGVGGGLGVEEGVGTAVGTGSGVGVATGPRSVIDWTGAGRPGIWIDWTDEPGGTSTVIVSVCPVTSVTLTRWSSAEAGTTSAPNSAAAASAITGLRRLIGSCESPLPQYRRGFALVRRILRGGEGVVAPYWSNMAVAIQERLNGARLAPISQLFDDPIRLALELQRSDPLVEAQPPRRRAFLPNCATFPAQPTLEPA